MRDLLDTLADVTIPLVGGAVSKRGISGAGLGTAGSASSFTLENSGTNCEPAPRDTERAFSPGGCGRPRLAPGGTLILTRSLIRTTTGWDPAHIARAWVTLMQRLGYNKFVAQGGDWGAVITELMGVQAPPELLGISHQHAWHLSSRN